MATVDSDVSGRSGGGRSSPFSLFDASGERTPRWTLSRRADLERTFWLNAGLTSLEGAESAGSSLLWLGVDGTRLSARFADPGLTAPPPGWSLSDRGLAAVRPMTAIGWPLADSDSSRRLPAMATVADGLMVNLAAGPLRVIGPRSATEAVLRSIIYGLINRSMSDPVEILAPPGLCPADLEPLVTGTPVSATDGAEPGDRISGRSVAVVIDGQGFESRQPGRRRSARPPRRLLISRRHPGSSSAITVTVDSNSATPTWSPPRPVRSVDGPAPTPAAHRAGRVWYQGRLWSDGPDLEPFPERPTIRVLGEVDLVGADWPLTSQQLSLLAFLACRSSADRAAIVNALWDGQAISQSRFPNLLAEVRARIGRHHLPAAVGGRYRLAGIDTDLTRFEVAAEAAAAGQYEDLQVALDLVRGPPLTAPGGRYWSWIEDRTDLSTEIETMITDAANGLAVQLRSRGDLDGAARACRQGLMACPFDENLVVLLTRLHLEAGRVNSARRLVEGWEAKVRRLDCGEPSAGPRAVLRAAGRSRFDSSAA